MTELYVLTDTHNFTVACHPSFKALSLEAARANLTTPVRVWHWHVNTVRDWVLREMFEWNGAPF